jgi:hypothetical protein
MRFAAVFLLLAGALFVSAPGAHASTADREQAVVAWEAGCDVGQGDCPFMCQSAPAFAAHQQSATAKPLSWALTSATPMGAPAVISRESPLHSAAIGLGPPLYLSFHRLLL